MEAASGEPFDPELISQYARNNALGFSLLTIAYLVDRGLSVKDWATWMGQQFAGPDMAREAALELVSSKGRLLSFSGDEQSSEVRFQWPSDESLSNARLARENIEPYWVIWQPLAASVGLEFDFSTSDDGVTTLRFTKNA